MKRQVFVAVMAVIAATASGAAAQSTLETVMDNGFVRCGVTEGVPGYSFPDENNNWTGIEVDYCRALAAAIFDDPDAVRYTPLTTRDRFVAMANGNIDVLSRQTTWTMSRDTNQGIAFAGVIFYDGQGFMVRADSGVTSTRELSGATVCIEDNTSTELNAVDYFAANGLDLSNAVFFDNQSEVEQAYLDGRCSAYSTDSSVLAASRSTFPDPDAHIILPEIISKEPLGPSVRNNDRQWFDIARWTYFALLNAEELGVTSENVDEMLGSDNPEVRRLLGVEGNFGAAIGLEADWAYRIISHVGNYGELYERHLGVNTPINIPRGINNLWTEGGIQYAPPIR